MHPVNNRPISILYYEFKKFFTVHSEKPSEWDSFAHIAIDHQLLTTLEQCIGTGYSEWLWSIVT